MIVIGTIILSFLILILLVIFVIYPKYTSNNETLIVRDIETTPKEIDKLNPVPEGYSGTITYSMALKVNKWNFSQKEPGEIFIHGVSEFKDMKHPGDIISIALDGIKNNLLFHVTTKDVTDTLVVEKILVDYIPIGKFFHLAIVSTKRRLDIYINCKLYKTHTFDNTRNLGIEGVSKFHFLNKKEVNMSYANVRYILTDINVPNIKKICNNDKIDDDDGRKTIETVESNSSTFFDSSNFNIGSFSKNEEKKRENMKKLLWDEDDTQRMRNKTSIMRSNVLAGGTEVLESVPATRNRLSTFFSNDS